MRIFLTIVSYLFHPIFIPVGGAVAYFLITPKHTPIELQAGNILPIFILTVIIPIITYLILKNIGVVNSIFMPTTSERKYPIVIHIVLLLMILYKVIPNNYIIELYFYFVGLIGASFTCLLLLFFNIKASLHLVGVGGLLMYLIGLSVHFEMNIIIGISIFICITGVVASSRLYLKAHTKPEIAIGLFIGILSQLMTLHYWL
ncbi:hypothetical protein ACFQZJ_03050 [Maribacter chungangensis]|uniref:Transmembrane protein n=1 Tax=Maribacter chungangensis TaxID=1069117 RepID=A0ABW3B0Y9_9FLAO